MKAVIVYAIVLLALSNGEDGIYLQSHHKAISRYGNPYENLLPAGKDGQTCIPGSKFKGVCRECFCSEDGTEIICSSGLCPKLPRHRRDAPSNERRKIHTSESCTICSCEFVDSSGYKFCSMIYYEICPARNIQH